MSCFICEPPDVLKIKEQPHQWMPLFEACGCHREAAILPNKMRVVDVLESASYQLEGSELGYLLNPVSVEDKTAWAFFFVGTWSVALEVFTSRNYFEFEVQHRSELLEPLYDLHENRALFAGDRSMPQLLNYITGLGTQDKVKRFEQLCSLSIRKEMYAQELKRLTIPCASSADQAVALMRKVGVVTASPEQMLSAVGELLEIAHWRFR